MQTGQPGSAPNPESSNNKPKELEPGYEQLHVLERKLHEYQSQLAIEQSEEYKEPLKEKIRDMKKKIAKHSDSHNDDPNSTYNQNDKNYYPGMSFTKEQKELIERLLEKYKQSGDAAIDDSAWVDKNNASDIEIINEIRNSMSVFHFFMNSQDLKEFDRLFPQYTYHKNFSRIRDIDYSIVYNSISTIENEEKIKKKERFTK
jgi:hypothetical protein